MATNFRREIGDMPSFFGFAKDVSRSKVKGQGQQGQKRTVHSRHPPASTAWNVFGANNVTQQQTRQFRRCQGVSSLACVRWAWRATTGLCHAFLVYYIGKPINVIMLPNEHS